MKLIVLCLCLASCVSAAPPSYHFLGSPHFGLPRQRAAPPQMNSGYGRSQNLRSVGPAAISMEIVYPQVYPPLFPGGSVGGSVPGSTNPSQAFIKYSLPKAPGQKSVEIYYPFDFSQQKVMPNFPPPPNLFPFDYPSFPQMTANDQQPANNPTFETSPPQLQDPFQPPKQDQPPQTNQVAGTPQV